MTREIIVDVLRGYDEVRSIGQIANEIVRRLAETQPAHGTSATERAGGVDAVKIARDFGDEELRGTSDFIRGAAYASESIALAIENAIRQALSTPAPKDETHKRPLFHHPV